MHGCRVWEDKAAEQSGIIEELQQHISHLEHLHEIEAASRKKALATHKVGTHPSLHTYSRMHCAACSACRHNIKHMNTCSRDGEPGWVD